MPTFNLREYMARRAAEIPNGVSVSEVPNGSDAGQGTLVSDGGASAIGGPQAKIPLREIVGDVLAAEEDGAGPAEVARLAKQAVNTEVPKELSGNDDAVKLVIALGRKASEDQSKPTVDPETGRPESGLADVAAAIAEQAGWDAGELVAESRQRAEMGGTPMQSAPDVSVPQATAAVRTAEKAAVPESVKKKKKGNPFKVLMGRVQKLLDHGIDERGEVVRTILRGKDNHWKRDTIEQAYEIVKERNVRKERKDRAVGPEPEKSDEKPPTKSFNLARHTAMQRRAADARFQGQPGETAQADRGKRRPSLYDVPRATDAMSFWELISRAQYLMSATNADSILLNENLTKDRPQQGSQTRGQLREIRAELSKRGYDADMLSRLFGIPVMRPDKTPQGQAIDKGKLDSVKPRQIV